MTVYFCLDHLLDRLVENPQDGLSTFIPVKTEIPSCNGHREDALTLSSQPKLLDMNEQRGIYQLAALLEEVPSYNLNMQSLVDEILDLRHTNNLIHQALLRTFDGLPLPETVDEPARLRHPMLEKLDKTTLAKIYLNFMRVLLHGHDAFSFERHVLGSHMAPFSEVFDGFVLGHGGKVKADILLGFSTRDDYDPRETIEHYIDNGRRHANLMHLSEAHEIIWVWLEAENYQMRRCHDIDRMLRLSGLRRLPNWVRTDIFNCLEKESTKQVLATKLVTLDPDLGIVAASPSIQRAVSISASGKINEDLLDLLEQNAQKTTIENYSGSAERFYLSALERQKESKRI